MLTRLKSYRLVNPDISGLRPVAQVTTPTEGTIVHLKDCGSIRLFTIVLKNGDSEWLKGQ